MAGDVQLRDGDLNKAPENFDEMVRQADILMYKAKNEGKDTIRSGIYG